MLFLSVQGLCYFHKMTQAQAGNTLLPRSQFLCLTEVRLFILPQTVAVLGVDVKVPGACGTKAMCKKGYACLRSACMCLFVHMKARVSICEHVRVGVVCFTLHLSDWMRT